MKKQNNFINSQLSSMDLFNRLCGKVGRIQKAFLLYNDEHHEENYLFGTELQA